MKNNQLVIIIFAFIIVLLMVIANTHHFERKSMTLEENVLPAVDFFCSPKNPINIDEVIQFNDNSANGSIIYWTWDFGDGTISNKQNPTHRYVFSGNHTVNLTLVDNNGAILYCEKEVVINTVPFANFSYSPKIPMDIDEIIQFTDNSTDLDGSIVNWMWNFSDGTTSTEQNPHHRFISAGTHTVNLTIADNNGAMSCYEKKIDIYNLGVLALAHGFPGRWNQQVREMVNKITLPVPVELGFLEFAPGQTINSAIKKLDKQGVNRVIAIPLFICGNSTHTPELFEALEDTDTKSDIICTTSLDDHSLIVEILINHGITLCKDDPSNPFDKEIDPSDATLIFYGHGDPGKYGENWISIAESVKDQIENRGIFKEVDYSFMHIGTGLKETVNKANGHPVVVPWFISRSIFSDKPIKKELRWDLIRGKCEYDSQHLVSHPDIIKWVETQFYNYQNVIEWSNYQVT
jgi:PKD repeat protein